MAKSETVTYEGLGPVLFERSTRARRLIISIRPFRGVRIAVPRGVSFTRAKEFVGGKMEWIHRHLPRVREIERCEEARQSRIPAVDREEARNRLVPRLTELAKQHGYFFNRVFIRYQKTRWGSCSSKNNINLNARLILLPDHLIDYVLLHELVHTRHKHHGASFWSELERIAGNVRLFRKELKSYNIL